MDLTTASLTDHVQSILAPRLPGPFRWYRSLSHFRRLFDGGCSYLAISAVTHDRVNYCLAFYLGVRQDAVEARIKELWGEGPKLGHYDRSIWNYTVNIGPTSPHWTYPVRGSWWARSLDGFHAQEREILAFVQDLALPFLEKHQDLRAIRTTLIEEPGHAQNLYPFEQIWAIDLLEGDRKRLAEDADLLDRRYAKYCGEFRERFQTFRARALASAGGLPA